MVFVKVRETYDLHTIKNKMSVIGIHTPGASIIKKNYPGLLMQCKAYRPVSCDVRLACASVLPLDPAGVGLAEGDVAPEDVFNPILYKALSNFGMSQIDAYVNGAGYDIVGATLDASTSGVGTDDDFALYYGLLAMTHEWKHAHPQQGLSMASLRPLVYEQYQTIGDNTSSGASNPFPMVSPDDSMSSSQIGNIAVQTFRGKSKPMPFINCTYPVADQNAPIAYPNGLFGSGESAYRNAQVGVPAPKVYCGVIIVPPCRLHEMFFRMVCEWTIEFSTIRALGDITNFAGLKAIGNTTHFQNYDYENSSKETILTDTTDLVDVRDGSEIKKVM